MEMLQEEDPTKYEAHFAKYIEAGIDADKMEEPDFMQMCQGIGPCEA